MCEDGCTGCGCCVNKDKLNIFCTGKLVDDRLVVTVQASKSYSKIIQSAFDRHGVSVVFKFNENEMKGENYD